MGFLEEAVAGLKGLFADGNDEMLFFITVFLLLIKGNMHQIYDRETQERDGGSLVFFAILFLLLFINIDNT